MMDKYKNENITQTAIVKITNSTPPYVSRWLQKNNFHPENLNDKKINKYSIKSAREIIGKMLKINHALKKKKHAFYNFKGGTGKTSLCYQVSAHLAIIGYKVLVIDLDPQSHLSVSFGFNEEDNLTLYDVIIKNLSVEKVIKSVFSGLDCIPSNLSLTRLESELFQLPKREERLSLELENLTDSYDFIFIDTNPTISSLNRNVVTYVDTLNIVCETQPYSLNGLKLLMEDLTRFYKHMQIKPRDINIIPNKYEDRTANSAEAMTLLRTYYSEYLKPDFAVRRSEDIITAAKLGKPLALFVKKNSVALDDIIELSQHIVNISR